MQRQWRRNRELPWTPDRAKDPRAAEPALHLRRAAVSDQPALFGRALDGAACKRLLPRAGRAGASRRGAEFFLDMFRSCPRMRESRTTSAGVRGTQVRIR